MKEVYNYNKLDVTVNGEKIEGCSDFVLEIPKDLIKISLTEIILYYYGLREKSEQRLGQLFCNLCVEDSQPELFYEPDSKQAFIMIGNYIEDRGLDKENLPVLHFEYYKQIDDLLTRENN